MVGVGGPEGLLVFFFGFHGFEILGFKDLTAIETFYVIDAIAAGNHLGAGVITSGGLHSSA